MSFGLHLFFGFLFGIGFGYFVQRSGLCFALGLGEIFMGKGKRIFQFFLIIFSITSLGFLLSGYFSSDLGLKTIGQIRGYGFYNLLSGVFFGAGIFLNGGCILGTLRQIGEGDMTFVIVLISFIPGMALIVKWLNPILQHGYHIQSILLPDLLGFPAPYITISLVIPSIIGLILLRKKRR